MGRDLLRKRRVAWIRSIIVAVVALFIYERMIAGPHDASRVAADLGRQPCRDEAIPPGLGGGDLGRQTQSNSCALCVACRASS